MYVLSNVLYYVNQIVGTFGYWAKFGPRATFAAPSSGIIIALQRPHKCMEQSRNATADRLGDKRPWIGGHQFIRSLESVGQFHYYRDIGLIMIQESGQ